MSPPLFQRIFKTKSPPMWFALCAPVVLNIGFGIYPVVVKAFASESGEKANGYIFTLYRGLGAAPTLFILSYFTEGKILLPELDTALAFLVFGFFGIFLGQFAYIVGVYRVGPDIASAMQPLIAVWTPLISVMCCVEKVPSFSMPHTYAKLIGIVIAVVGAANLISGSPNPHSSEGEQAAGYLCLLLDTVCASIYYALQKKLIYQKRNCVLREYPMAQTAYAYLCGSFFMVLFNLYYIFTGQLDQFLIPSHSLPALAYAIFITSTFCYFLISWSNRHLPSSILTSFWPVQVLVTVCFAYIVFGDELTAMQCLGALLILVGLGLVIYSNHVDEQLEKEKAKISAINNHLGT